MVKKSRIPRVLISYSIAAFDKRRRFAVGISSSVFSAPCSVTEEEINARIEQMAIETFPLKLFSHHQTDWVLVDQELIQQCCECD